LTSSQIREQFFSFFEQKGHTFIQSSKIFLKEDPSLLFVNAGMNQFKNIFMGQKKAEYKRIVDTQKCLRVSGKHNDLDEVGFDNYHHTFFEMLGSWSFGDYYKKEAIIWSWELLTQVFKLPKEKLYATVFESDDEAFKLWETQTDVDKSHILRFAQKFNFWEMGEVGPCGPCTELHYDFGEGSCSLENDPQHTCGINKDCERYIEVWNIVFMENQRLEDGKVEELATKFIDTGMGLERITRILQNKKSNYETDLFWPIIEALEKEANLRYKESSKELQGCFCVVADHVRALVFAIGDGVIPSNTSRGYVLRRILRRAVKYAKNLGIDKPFLYLLADVVIKEMKGIFKDLEVQKQTIKEYLKVEEEKFIRTLDKGLTLFEKETKALKRGDTLEARVAFTLFDTYGFPFDLTLLLAKEKGIKINEKEFDLLMQGQRDLAKKNKKLVKEVVMKEFVIVNNNIGKTEFLGYKQYSATGSKVVRYRLLEEGKIELVLDKTPFYAESGGQVADKGTIYSSHYTIEVEDVQKDGDDDVQFIHYGKIIKGEFNPNDSVDTQINVERREALKRHHSSTHMLIPVIQSVLNNKEIEYNSTYVAEDYFTCELPISRLSPQEIKGIEKLFLQYVMECHPVTTTIENKEEALKNGAIGRFESKYKDEVRVVNIQGVCVDLCGGTHVSNTGEIGIFKIISDSSAGVGMRRLECRSGFKAWEYLHDFYEESRVLANELKIPIPEIPKRVETYLTEIKSLRKELKESSKKTGGQELSFDKVKKIGSIGSVPFFLGIFDEALVPFMKKFADESINANHALNITLLCSLSPSLSYNLSMSPECEKMGIDLLALQKKINPIIDGKGGGRGLHISGGYQKKIDDNVIAILKSELEIK
jgi:alanyl-tRNA synthetase